jgi:hypothetical protein
MPGWQIALIAARAVLATVSQSCRPRPRRAAGASQPV